MKKFISCDWGTSSFRLRLINAETKKAEAEIKTAQGIAATFALWKAQSNIDRLSYYANFLLQQVRLLEQQCGYSLNDLTIIISGMASAAIGMIELPYKKIPFYVNRTQLETHLLPPELSGHRMMIVSGVCSNDDVMRGEETILAGCNIEDMHGEQLFIFPGTHSKHVVVKDGMIKDIKTFMTGEVFELLSTKSILADSVEKEDVAGENNPSFLKGVLEARASNFLNSIFHIRTNALFGNLDKKENYHFLSGLLIGEELKYLQGSAWYSITIVSTGALLALYTQALAIAGFNEQLKQQNADEALINGQTTIFNRSQ